MWKQHEERFDMARKLEESPMNRHPFFLPFCFESGAEPTLHSTHDAALFWTPAEERFMSENQAFEPYFEVDVFGTEEEDR
jgi:hypothetical protein